MSLKNLGMGITFFGTLYGKIILVVIVPLIGLFVYDYYIQPSILKFVYLFITVSSSLAFSLSSLFLIPSCWYHSIYSILFILYKIENKEY